MMNPTGIGIIIAARHPSNVPAHCTPRLTNICRAKRGKHAPTADRRMVLAAKTDAALFGQKLSTICVTGRCLQLQIRIDQVVETLQKDAVDAEPCEQPGRCRGHPMDRPRPSGPAIPNHISQLLTQQKGTLPEESNGERDAPHNGRGQPPLRDGDVVIRPQLLGIRALTRQDKHPS